MNPDYLYFQVHGRKPARSTTTARQHRGPARSWKYKAWIRTFPCCACGTTVNVEAAHTGSDGGKAQKSSDFSCVPLCSDCHQFGAGAYHGINGGAKDFQRRPGLDFPGLVKMLNSAWKVGKAEAA